MNILSRSLLVQDVTTEASLEIAPVSAAWWLAMENTGSTTGLDPRVMMILDEPGTLFTKGLAGPVQAPEASIWSQLWQYLGGNVPGDPNASAQEALPAGAERQEAQATDAWQAVSRAYLVGMAGQAMHQIAVYLEPDDSEGSSLYSSSLNQDANPVWVISGPADGPSQAIAELFRHTNLETLEDEGVVGFVQGLHALVEKQGNVSIRAIDRACSSLDFSSEVRALALKALGSFRDDWTYTARVKLLTRFLHDEDVRIRDGALSGLANLDDPQTITAVASALDREPSPRLQRKLQLVLEQLKEPERWPNILE